MPIGGGTAQAPSTPHSPPVTLTGQDAAILKQAAAIAGGEINAMSFLLTTTALVTGSTVTDTQVVESPIDGKITSIVVQFPATTSSAHCIQIYFYKNAKQIYPTAGDTGIAFEAYTLSIPMNTPIKEGDEVTLKSISSDTTARIISAAVMIQEDKE